ncbi:hypothetical protein [Rhodococcus ruber]|uniref:hypothetical protein n=1 Tax=Rhodococcus ruber TaxID=1830 RepID=UPI000E6B432D|nr:hypothetical protein [Rhodococcus ruber]
MATSSKAAARRSLRPHTTPNVRENLRREKERLLARQAELETLAAPIIEVAAQLAKIDALVDARATAAQRRIAQLEKARDTRIEKIRAEFAAKIAAARTDAESTELGLTPQEHAHEEALLLDYARAIAAFTEGASATELASVLGVGAREAKQIIEQAKTDLAASSGPRTVVETASASTVDTAVGATSSAAAAAVGS